VDRRDFLHTTGLGLAAVSLPGWLQACSGGVGTGSDGPLEGDPKSGAEALALAKRNGRPLLVFVVPMDPMRRSIRGEALGVYLNRVSAEGMADLALCGVWCATPAEIRSDLAPKVVVDDTTVAVLIETDRENSTLITLDPSFDASPWNLRISDAESTQQARARTELLRARLHAAIVPDKGTLHRRAELARARFLPRTDRYPLGTMGETDVPNVSHVKRVPAWVRWRAENAGENERAQWIAMLSEEAVKRLRAAPLPRTRWATSSGCGTHYENETGSSSAGVLCGMGRITEYSSRFLDFYSEGE
jgi:hypothetical protein